jgi:hypothetical protein
MIWISLLLFHLTYLLTSGDPLASIVSNTYPNLLEDMSNIDYFQNRAILASKNSIVDRINEYVLDLHP